MAVQDRPTLKSYFETGDVPTEQQFADLIDSMLIQGEGGGDVPLSSNILVLSNQGDNGTAEKGKMNKAWSTPIGVRDAALPGDLIWVTPGTYTITDADWAAGGATPAGASLWKDGIVWYFSPGATVEQHISRANQPTMIYGKTDGESCHILGRGNFVNANGAWDGTGANSKIFDISAADVEATFHAHDVIAGDNADPIVTHVKNVDIDISGTVSSNRGGVIYIAGSTGRNTDYYSMRFNRIHQNANVSNNAYNKGTAIEVAGGPLKLDLTYSELKCNAYHDIEGTSIHCRADDSIININGNYLINTRTDGASLISSLIAVRSTHNSTINIHTNNCIATSLRTNKSLIMLHNNDSEETANPNTIKITGRYEAIQGRVIGSEEGGSVYNSASYVLDGEFISRTSEVCLLHDANVDVTLKGIIRCLWDDPAGHGINITNASNNVQLQDLDIVCTNAGAKAINATIPVTMEAKNLSSATNDNSSNVTLVKPAGFAFPETNTILEKKITLSTAQINNGNTTPIEVVPAPGAGKVISVVDAAFKFNYDTAAFGTNFGMELNNPSADEAQSNSAIILMSTSDKFVKAPPTASVNTQLVENEPLNAQVPNGDPTGGGSSTLDIYVTYMIKTL